MVKFYCCNNLITNINYIKDSNRDFKLENKLRNKAVVKKKEPTWVVENLLTDDIEISNAFNCYILRDKADEWT